MLSHRYTNIYTILQNSVGWYFIPPALLYGKLCTYYENEILERTTYISLHNVIEKGCVKTPHLCSGTEYNHPYYKTFLINDLQGNRQITITVLSKFVVI